MRRRVVDWGWVRGRAAATTGTWPEPGRAAPWVPRLPDLTRVRQRVAPWIAAEVAPGRLMPWLPVAFGGGVAIYFTADREPAWWAALAVVAAGFATATVRTALLVHPVLARPLYNVDLSGYVEAREERERTDRIT